MEKIVQRTYSKLIFDKRLLDLSREAAECYNLSLNTFWQVVEDENKWLNKFSLQAEIKGKFDRKLLHSDSYLGAIQQFSKAFTSYVQAHKAYEKEPAKFSGEPKPPHKIKETVSVFFKQSALHVKEGILSLSLAQGQEPIKTRWNSNLGIPKFAVIAWNKNYGWKLHLVVEKTLNTNDTLDETKSEGVDLGNKRLATTCDEDGNVITYSGKKIKSLIRLREKLKKDVLVQLSKVKEHGKKYKKIKRALRKMVHRIDNKIKDILHKTSRTMVNDCIEKKIGVATIGDSAGTHDGTNFGAVNNQAIVQCPEQKLAAYFSYKFEDIGGKVRYVPEYYTSQTCPQCGCRNIPKNRTYKCKKCGFKYDRDGVGSINIWGIGEKVSLGGAKANLSVVGLLTNPIGWKYYSTHDCLIGPKRQFV